MLCGDYNAIVSTLLYGYLSPFSREVGGSGGSCSSVHDAFCSGNAGGQLFCGVGLNGGDSFRLSSRAIQYGLASQACPLIEVQATQAEFSRSARHYCSGETSLDNGTVTDSAIR